MSAIDRRPAYQQALTWLGMAAVCSPLVLAAAAAIEAAEPHGAPSATLQELLFGVGFLAICITIFAAVIAQAANPSFQIAKPDIGEFIKGLIYAPLLLVFHALVFTITAVFIAALAGFLVFGLRQL